MRHPSMAIEITRRPHGRALGWVVAALSVGSIAGCSFDTTAGEVERGNTALLEGKVDEAKTAYDEAAQNLPESPELNLDRGLAASLAGDHAGAASLLLQALATKDKVLEQKVKAALGTAYAREALVLERTPAPDPKGDPSAPPTTPPDAADAKSNAPKVPEAAMAKWKLAVEFLDDALVLDPNDAESRHTLEVALLRVDPPCATRDDHYEDNDSQGSAKPIEVKAEEANQSQLDPQTGQPVDPNAAQSGPKDVLRAREQLFSCPDDDDWYVLELAGGDRLELAPTVPKDAGHLAFDLLSPTGQKVWSWTSNQEGAPPRFKATIAEADQGKWLVHVRNVEFDEVSYGLEVVVKPACAKTEDRFEDNDTAETAKTVTPGPVPDLKLCPADDDWYSVTLAEGESLFLYLQTDKKEDEDEKRPEGAPAPPPPVAVTVYDETGKERASGAPAEQARISTLLMPGAGRYLIKVSQLPGVAPEAAFEGRYHLQVEVVPPCPEGDDRFEDNDRVEDATDLLEASKPAAGAGGAQPQQQGPPVVFARVCPGDVDWWKVTSDGKTPQIASLVFDHGQGDLALTLYDETGTTSLASSDQSAPDKNGEAVALPLEPAPDPNAPNAPNAKPAAGTPPDPNAPPGAASAPKAEPKPRTFTLQVTAKDGQQNFYLLRLDKPSGGGGDKNKDDKKDKDDKDQDKKDPGDKGDKDKKDQQDPKDPNDKKDPKDDAKKDEANPLQDALDNLDRNPENLQARDAAKKSPLANQKPLKDW
ncbi:MAG: hypothetical protein JNJ59_16990 [Deltaproteobacteria bacterium]|nr:hypothetical protein [Deltaproteobacteria bacterium]